jgi:hypothetical protein
MFPGCGLYPENTLESSSANRGSVVIRYWSTRCVEKARRAPPLEFPVATLSARVRNDVADLGSNAGSYGITSREPVSAGDEP